jgi:hypothetical protein
MISGGMSYNHSCTHGTLGYSPSLRISIGPYRGVWEKMGLLHGQYQLIDREKSCAYHPQVPQKFRLTGVPLSVSGSAYVLMAPFPFGNSTLLSSMIKLTPTRASSAAVRVASQCLLTDTASYLSAVEAVADMTTPLRAKQIIIVDLDLNSFAYVSS